MKLSVGLSLLSAVAAVAAALMWFHASRVRVPESVFEVRQPPLPHWGKPIPDKRIEIALHHLGLTLREAGKRNRWAALAASASAIAQALSAAASAAGN